MRSEVITWDSLEPLSRRCLRSTAPCNELCTLRSQAESCFSVQHASRRQQATCCPSSTVTKFDVEKDAEDGAVPSEALADFLRSASNIWLFWGIRHSLAFLRAAKYLHVHRAPFELEVGGLSMNGEGPSTHPNEKVKLKRTVTPGCLFSSGCSKAPEGWWVGCLPRALDELRLDVREYSRHLKPGLGVGPAKKSKFFCTSRFLGILPRV